MLGQARLRRAAVAALVAVAAAAACGCLPAAAAAEAAWPSPEAALAPQLGEVVAATWGGWASSWASSWGSPAPTLSLLSSSSSSSSSSNGTSDNDSDGGERSLDFYFPRNVTTLYRGSWNGTMRGTRAPMDASHGKVMMRLEAAPSDAGPYVHYVEGVLSLRRGDAAADDDLVAVLRGLYFRQAGLLEIRSVSYDDGTGLRERAEEPGDGPVGRDQHGVSLCEVHGQLQADVMTEAEELEEVSGVPGRPVAVRLSGLVRSDNCGFEIRVAAHTMDFAAYFNKVGNYILLVIGISLGQISLVVRQMQASSSPARAARISMLTVTMMALLDATVCLVHLLESVMMSDPLFQAFVAISFFQFFMFSVFELRFLLVIWKARRPDAFNNGWENLRREFSALYTQFYGFIVLGLILIYQLREYLHVLAFPLLSMWVPQIVANAREDTNRALSPQFVAGMSVTRLFLPLYVWGCPVNFFALQTVLKQRPVVCGLLVAWVAAQALFLHLQDRYHARFFIPARFLPPKFDYHEIELAELDDTEEHNCPICYSELELDPAGGASHDDLMRTPCNHVFHTHCLTRWMEQKMECPTCRAVLPPL